MAENNAISDDYHSMINQHGFQLLSEHGMVDTWMDLRAKDRNRRELHLCEFGKWTMRWNDREYPGFLQNFEEWAARYLKKDIDELLILS